MEEKNLEQQVEQFNLEMCTIEEEELGMVDELGVEDE